MIQQREFGHQRSERRPDDADAAYSLRRRGRDSRQFVPAEEQSVNGRRDGDAEKDRLHRRISEALRRAVDSDGGGATSRQIAAARGDGDRRWAPTNGRREGGEFSRILAGAATDKRQIVGIKHEPRLVTASDADATSERI